MNCPEYHLISSYYGSNTAERSGVRLINHIDEGLDILERLGASEEAKKAFCLHPLLQADKELFQNWRQVNECDPVAVLLAMEYRRAANAYLCKFSTDLWDLGDIWAAVGTLLPEVRLMLIADKEQNHKDFLKYHKGTHERSVQLQRYFTMWRAYLRQGDPE